MIRAKFTVDVDRKMIRFNERGHAGRSIKANDIVCAAASMLAMTLAQTVTEERNQGHYSRVPTIRLRNGSAAIYVKCKDEETFAESMHTFYVIQNGFRLLGHNYPEFVDVSVFGETPRFN